MKIKLGNKRKREIQSIEHSNLKLQSKASRSKLNCPLVSRIDQAQLPFLGCNPKNLEGEEGEGKAREKLKNNKVMESLFSSFSWSVFPFI